MVLLIVNWVFGSLALVLLVNVSPGFRVTAFQSALLATAIVGLISAAIATLLKQVTSQTGLAISGILLLVFDIFLFRVTALLVPGFAMRGFYPAAAGAMLLVALHLTLLRVLRTKSEAVEPRPIMHS